jgi:hypothetical protein
MREPKVMGKVIRLRLYRTYTTEKPVLTWFKPQKNKVSLEMPRIITI